jgi:hypothetical protein
MVADTWTSLALRACKPDMPLTATTLTLLCHKERVTPVSSQIGLERLSETACEGLNITPEQLLQELEVGGDLQDLASGALTSRGLRLAAETLTLRYSDSNVDVERETRRLQALGMLAQEPRLQYALASDDESKPDAVILTLAVRDKATCELRIPNDKYDGLALLELLEQLTGGSYAST